MARQWHVKSALRRGYRKALAAKLDEAHAFHHVRHTFGTRMAAAGVSMRTLQEWMGHRDIATAQLYADYAPSAHEAELVAAAFAREADGSLPQGPEVTKQQERKTCLTTRQSTIPHASTRS